MPFSSTIVRTANLTITDQLAKYRSQCIRTFCVFLVFWVIGQLLQISFKQQLVTRDALYRAHHVMVQWEVPTLWHFLKIQMFVSVQCSRYVKEEPYKNASQMTAVLSWIASPLLWNYSLMLEEEPPVCTSIGSSRFGLMLQGFTTWELLTGLVSSAPMVQYPTWMTKVSLFVNYSFLGNSPASEF